MEIIVILVSVVMLYLVIAYLRQLDKKLDILERMYVEEVQDLRKMVKILIRDYLLENRVDEDYYNIANERIQNELANKKEKI